MSANWQYTCTSSDNIDAVHLAKHMSTVANDGWELITAQMSTYEVNANPNGSFPVPATRYRCTMFWRKPIGDDPTVSDLNEEIRRG